MGLCGLVWFGSAWFGLVCLVVVWFGARAGVVRLCFVSVGAFSFVVLRCVRCCCVLYLSVCVRFVLWRVVMGCVCVGVVFCCVLSFAFVDCVCFVVCWFVLACVVLCCVGLFCVVLLCNFVCCIVFWFGLFVFV